MIWHGGWVSKPDSLIQRARQCLEICDPDQKVAFTHYTTRQWQDGLLVLKSEIEPDPQAVPVPGRPELPVLVAPRNVSRRKAGTLEGQQALVHAICHIEFNAINLALDAIYRFRDMPEAYYADWLKVADEEAYHFSLLRERLQQLGCDYGDFDAHNGLWEMACKTDHDVMVRMALVPRVLEARGLDVTPGMMQRLRSAGDHRTVSLLEIILRDEIGHVAVGSRWFEYCCEQRGLKSEAVFQQLLDEYMKGYIKGPFFEEARKQAGFTEQEINMLKRQSSGVNK